MRKLLSSILCLLIIFSLLGCMPQSSKGSVPSPTDLAPELKSPEALLIKSFVNDSKFMAKIISDGEEHKAFSVDEWFLGRFEVITGNFIREDADENEAKNAIADAKYVLEFFGKSSPQSFVRLYDNCNYVLSCSEGTESWQKFSPDMSLEYSDENARLFSNIRREIDGYELGFENICFKADSSEPYEIAKIFMEKYVGCFDSLSPGNVYELEAYDLSASKISVEAVSEDAESFTLSFEFHFKPKTDDISVFWAGNTVESEVGDGWLRYFRFVRMDMDTEGYWHAWQHGTGNVFLDDEVPHELREKWQQDILDLKAED